MIKTFQKIVAGVSVTMFTVILVALPFVVNTPNIASAQTKPPTNTTTNTSTPKTTPKVTPKTTTAPAKAVKMQTAKPAAATAKPAASNSAVKLKKDGTPDKRYKTK